MTVSASITINASKAAVWAATSDIARFAELLTGVEKIEVVEKPATGLVGLKWNETRMLFGKPATVEKWINEVKENEFYKTRAEQDGFVFITTNRISGSDGSVTLTGIHETLPQGFAARVKSLPMVFFKGVIKKAILQDLNDIKKEAELGRSAYTERLTIPYKGIELVITAESPDIPRYDASLADNACAPEEEYFLGEDGYQPSSRHRITVRYGDAVLASRVLLASGGASGVHVHSAFVHEDSCLIAVGPFVCALELPSLRLLWRTPTDAATCFGVYDAPGYESIISHGELQIARLNYSGQLLWSGSGRDIFSEGFELHEHHAEAIDFDGTRYRFDLETGHSNIVSA